MILHHQMSDHEWHTFLAQSKAAADVLFEKNRRFSEEVKQRAPKQRVPKALPLWRMSKFVQLSLRLKAQHGIELDIANNPPASTRAGHYQKKGGALSWMGTTADGRKIGGRLGVTKLLKGGASLTVREDGEMLVVGIA